MSSGVSQYPFPPGNSLNGSGSQPNLQSTSSALAPKPVRKSRRKSKDDNLGNDAGQAVGSGGRVNRKLSAQENVATANRPALANRVSSAPQNSFQKNQKLPLTPDELETCCGVASDPAGSPCRRPISCMRHSDNCKRAVIGRKRSYHILLQDWHARGHHPSCQPGPVPLATRKFRLQNHHFMRSVLSGLFQEASKEKPDARPLPPPLATQHMTAVPILPSSARLDPTQPTSMRPSSAQNPKPQMPPVIPLSEVKKPKPRARKVTAVKQPQAPPPPEPSLRSPQPLKPSLNPVLPPHIPPTQVSTLHVLPLHSTPSFTTQKAVPEPQKTPSPAPKAKARARAPRNSNLSPVGNPNPKGATPRSRAGKSIKQRKALQRQQEEERLKKAQEEEAGRVQNPFPAVESLGFQGQEGGMDLLADLDGGMGLDLGDFGDHFMEDGLTFGASDRTEPGNLVDSVMSQDGDVGVAFVQDLTWTTMQIDLQSSLQNSSVQNSVQKSLHDPMKSSLQASLENPLPMIPTQGLAASAGNLMSDTEDHFANSAMFAGADTDWGALP